MCKYVVKPFSPKELMMRVNVVVSRHSQSAENNTMDDGHDVFVAEGLMVDFTSRVVTIDGKKAVMTEHLTLTLNCLEVV